MLPDAITLPLMLMLDMVPLPTMEAVVAIAGTLMVVLGAGMAEVKGTSATLDAPTKAGAALRVGTRFAGAGGARPGLSTLVGISYQLLLALMSGYLRVNNVRHTIGKQDIRQHDLSLVKED